VPLPHHEDVLEPRIRERAQRVGQQRLIRHRQQRLDDAAGEREQALVLASGEDYGLVGEPRHRHGCSFGPRRRKVFKEEEGLQ
jgi:hypothetical protein